MDIQLIHSTIRRPHSSNEDPSHVVLRSYSVEFQPLLKPQKNIRKWIAEQIESSELLTFLILSWIQIY